MTIHSLYTDSAFGILKFYATVVSSYYWVIVQGAIRLWWQGENGPQNFSDDVFDLAFNQWIRVQSWIEFS